MKSPQKPHSKPKPIRQARLSKSTRTLKWAAAICLCAGALAFPQRISAQAFPLTADQDSYVRNGSAGNTNYGNDTTFQVLNTSRLGYIGFNVASLNPAVTGRSIAAATVKIKLRSTIEAGTIINVYALNAAENGDGWGETTLTYNNRPGPDLSTQATLVGTLAPAPGGTDVTLTPNGTALLSAIQNAGADQRITLIVTGTSGETVPTSFGTRPLNSSSTGLTPALMITMSGPPQTFWVSPTGVDINPGTQIAPLRTLAAGYQKAYPGDTIRLTAGTFTGTATVTNTRPGISVIGNGSAGTARSTLTGSFSSTPAEIQNNSGGPPIIDLIEGNGAVFRDLEFYGGAGRTVATGLRIKWTKGLTVDNVSFNNFGAQAATWKFSSNIHASNIEIRESGYESNSFSYGALALGDLADCYFQSIAIYSTLPGTGYGVKSGTNLTRVIFDDMHIDLKANSAWNGGNSPNFGFEVINGVSNNVEIRNSYIRNTISIPGGTKAVGADYSIRIHHNDLDIKPGAYTIELGTSDAIVDHNYIYSSEQIAGTHAGIGYNFKVLGSGPYNNIQIHHNVFDKIGTFFHTKATINDMFVYNNTIYYRQDPRTGGLAPRNNLFLRQENGTGLAGDNWQVINNILVAPPMTAGQQCKLMDFYNSTPIPPVPTNLVIKNNTFQNIDTTPAYITTLSSNLTGSPGISASGVRPLPYYALSSSSSMAVNAGLDVGFPFSGSNPDIGAQELGTVFDIGQPKAYFVDDFEDGDLVDWTLYPTYWANKLEGANRVLEQTRLGTPTTAYTASVASISLADFQINASVKAVESASTVGLRGRINAAGDYYLARLEANGGLVKIIKFRDGSLITLAQANTTFTVNQWRQLSFEVRGNTLRCYLDGATTPIVTATDSALPNPGQVGVRVNGSARLDNIEVIP